MMRRMEIRNPMAETRKKAEVRNPKDLAVPGNPKGIADLPRL
jgi:hypothetical protein